MFEDGYSFYDGNARYPNMIPYDGGKFKITFNGGDTQYVYCHLTSGSTAYLVRLDNGVNFDSQFTDMAHVEVIE